MDLASIVRIEGGCYFEGATGYEYTDFWNKENYPSIAYSGFHSLHYICGIRAGDSIYRYSCCTVSISWSRLSGILCGLRTA